MVAAAQPPGSRPWLAFASAAVGFAVSLLLQVMHVRAYLAPSDDAFCSVTPRLDCEMVARSAYAVVLGVPLPVWGAIGFLSIGFAVLRRSKLALGLSGVAAVVSVVLFALSITELKTVCLLCEVVHVSALLAFVGAWVHRRRLGPLSARDVWQLVGIPAIAVLFASTLIPRYWSAAFWLTGPGVPTGVDEAGHPWMGAEQPELVIHEFVDYGCPHCAAAAGRMRRAIEDDPRLRVVRRHVSRTRCESGSPYACLYLRAVLCAHDQDKFWQMDAWVLEHGPQRLIRDWGQAVDAVGLDGASFEVCLADPSTYARADRIAAESAESGIRRTPAYAVDGRQVSQQELHDML